MPQEDVGHIIAENGCVCMATGRYRRRASGIEPTRYIEKLMYRFDIDISYHIDIEKYLVFDISRYFFWQCNFVNHDTKTEGHLQQR